ncbi:MAG: hypothetical protein OES46_22035 [Gammaproteobacteria bacterium]|nr:hypothetical protein [Gammaproteobacteria bacterium]
MIAVTQAAGAKNNKSLVILGSSLTALALARDAYGNKCSPIIFDRIPDIACHSRLAHVEPSKNTSEAELIRTITHLGGDRRNLLIATSDYWLNLIVKYRELLKEAYATVLHPRNNVLRLCLDKKKFALWCQEHGVTTPAVLITDRDPVKSTRIYKQLTYPVFLRPSVSSAALSEDIPKSVEIADANSLDHWLNVFHQKNMNFILTESLLNHNLTQYSVPLVRTEDRLVSFVAEKIRPLPAQCSVGTFVALAPNPEVESLARQTASLLDYYGIGEVEILHSRDTGENYVIEFNARPWIQYALAVKSGHNFLQALLADYSDNRDKPVKTGKYWINLGDDLYVCFSRTVGYVRKRDIRFCDYLKSLLQANVYAIFSWRDLVPFCYAVGRLFNSVTKRGRAPPKARSRDR